ncbi:MAG: cupredoxin domain-containing protein [Candidatus Neomarinimicrobiota bacterium]
MNKLRLAVLGWAALSLLPACSSSEKSRAGNEATATQPRVIRIMVGPDGFTPDSIVANIDESLVLEFLRTTDKTCATSVIFPYTDLRYELPLNKAVRISATLRSGQQLAFVCPMDMYSGNVTGRRQEHIKERVERRVVSETSPRIIPIVVDKEGFSPATLMVQSGKAVILRFKRVTEQTCATRVVIPALQIERELPIDQEVDIEIVPTKTGDIGFACQMDMIKGTIKVIL